MCNICEVPMKTEKNSEKGEMISDYYMTQEIKVCPQCGKRVLETYEAKVLKS